MLRRLAVALALVLLASGSAWAERIPVRVTVNRTPWEIFRPERASGTFRFQVIAEDGRAIQVDTGICVWARGAVACLPPMYPPHEAPRKRTAGTLAIKWEFKDGAVLATIDSSLDCDPRVFVEVDEPRTTNQQHLAEALR